MKQNMGNTDRIIRILAAVLIAVLYFTNTITGTFAYLLLAVGSIFLITSVRKKKRWHCFTGGDPGKLFVGRI